VTVLTKHAALSNLCHCLLLVLFCVYDLWKQHTLRDCHNITKRICKSKERSVRYECGRVRWHDSQVVNNGLWGNCIGYASCTFLRLQTSWLVNDLVARKSSSHHFAGASGLMQAASDWFCELYSLTLQLDLLSSTFQGCCTYGIL